jgi:protein phosphatase
MEVGLRIDSASVTDRGLSDKRPQNEDSFLEMNRCGIFAVADGVGGAQAGDVASQMAVEILGEAFANRKDGSDAEDVMREAIEQANAAIYQMANELPQLSSMATTMVALHLAGNIATIGHVGDSRLYRVDRSGDMIRETDDHSMVAEEVRAGRMTEEQAENHPGRNIISRALGAEPTVDVDLKTILVEPGTAFLLCSDGITRHVADNEIKGVLTFGGEPEEICEFLKKTCFERGAEDNLTAVVVKVRGESKEPERFAPPAPAEDEEVTVATARSPFEEILEESDRQDLLELDTRELVTTEPPDREEAALEQRQSDPFEMTVDETPYAQPAVEQVWPSEPVEQPKPEPSPDSSLTSFDQTAEAEPNGTFRKMASALALLFVGALVGLAGYHLFLRPEPANNLPISTMTTNNIPLSSFEENRRNVDNDPVAWVNKNSGTAQDCEDYYLLGRAFLLMGDFLKARTALIESRDRLRGADPANAKVIADEIAMGLAVTNDTTIQTTLKKELNDAAAMTANSNTAR